jgi:endonuclease YncB( thermonuclease family)
VPIVCTNPVVDARNVVVVLSVQDGDTFRIRIGEKDSIGVRILGGDTFESRRGDRLNSQAAQAGISAERALERGKIAKQLAQRILTERNAQIEISRKSDEPNIDIFGRLLRVCAVGGKEYFTLLPDSVKVK